MPGREIKIVFASKKSRGIAWNKVKIVSNGPIVRRLWVYYGDFIKMGSFGALPRQTLPLKNARIFPWLKHWSKCVSSRNKLMLLAGCQLFDLLMAVSARPTPKELDLKHMFFGHTWAKFCRSASQYSQCGFHSLKPRRNWTYLAHVV